MRLAWCSDPQHSESVASRWQCGSRTYLGVVAWVEFLRHWGDVLSQELEPLFLKANLVHVDVHSGDVLIAAGKTLVLQFRTK